MSTRIVVWILAITASAAIGCSDGDPCDPGQRYDHGLCYDPEPEPDAGVANADAGQDAGAVAARVPAAAQRPEISADPAGRQTAIAR